MQWINPQLVVCDQAALIALNYARHAPALAGFSLPRPYQAPPKDGDAASLAEASTEEGDGSKSGSKRKRGGRRKPLNAGELEAAARHEASAETLANAARDLGQWLAASGAATLRDALAGSPAEGPGALQASPAHQAAAPAGEQAQAAAAEEEEEAGPSYVALYQLRQAVRPKLEWAAIAEAGEEAEEGAASAAEEAGDLFGRLVVSSGGAERLALAAGHPVLVPPRCVFLMSDITALRPLLPGPGQEGYHCIVMDPPWENRSASRGAAYPTLPSRNLLGLPLRRLAHGGGCLVALWVTNRERHRRFIEEEALPAWGLRQLAAWHWLKVTDSGVPVGRLDCAHRRPYETLLLCCSGGEWPPGRLPPDGLVLAAVPSQHSRKPHLGPLLAAYLPPQARCLELFARELFSGWTSWGNEVLKFQASTHFQAKALSLDSVCD